MLIQGLKELILVEISFSLVHVAFAIKSLPQNTSKQTLEVKSTTQFILFHEHLSKINKNECVHVYTQPVKSVDTLIVFFYSFFPATF